MYNDLNPLYFSKSCRVFLSRSLTWHTSVEIFGNLGVCGKQYYLLAWLDRGKLRVNMGSDINTRDKSDTD